MEVRCKYDGCCEFEAGSWNATYCPTHGCKRKAEASKNRLLKPIIEYDEEAWQLEENRKIARVRRRSEKNKWILRTKKIVMFDIETSNLSADIGEMLCACTKPLGGDITTLVATRAGDKKLAKALQEELSKADYICGHYATRFDVPFLNTRLLVHNKPLLSMYRLIDTYFPAKFKLRLHSNRQGSIAELMFGKTIKTRVVGPIWTKALRGDKASMQYIIEHCQADVTELEAIFVEMAEAGLLNLSEVGLRL